MKLKAESFLMYIHVLKGKTIKVRVISKARKYLKCLYVQLQNAFIIPYSMYCSQIWGSTNKSNSNKLQDLQNKAVCIISESES